MSWLSKLVKKTETELLPVGVMLGLIRGSAAEWSLASPDHRREILGRWLVDWLMKQSKAIRDEVNRV